ncbi:hypothetical protein PQ455_13375 [Sphingomonas naphthae]|uniref:DUF2384 domain-containing protein n=1 Tax=Sphingomonas naphthae TaxID=1813468 RepID=A0ABY7THC9_9SPHN|nr:hypothetical protein [Sphingomonas naphthae]WCT72618.1 hypothetical protein PQ455_13375 [Sphingomonas naphthae]
MTDTIDALHELKTMRSSWQALARRWEFTGRELAQLLPEGGWDTPSPPADTERRMRLMLSVDYRLPFGSGSYELSSWARTPIDELDLFTPIELIAAGPPHIRALRDFVEWKFS